MRTIFVESRTSTVVSAPASLVNTTVFPEMDLIVPNKGDDLTVPWPTWVESCCNGTSAATTSPRHVTITAVMATTDKRSTAAYPTGFRKSYCSRSFMNPSSISYFRAMTHLYLQRLDVPFVQTRFTLSPTSHKRFLRVQGYSYLLSMSGFWGYLLPYDSGPISVILYCSTSIQIYLTFIFIGSGAGNPKRLRRNSRARPAQRSLRSSRFRIAHLYGNRHFDQCARLRIFQS